MVMGLQIVGLIFGLSMLYLTFVYHKKDSYGEQDFRLWTIIWLCYLFAVTFPEKLLVIKNPLEIVSYMDLFTIVGFMLFSFLIFNSHRITRENQRKIDKLILVLSKRKKGK